MNKLEEVNEENGDGIAKIKEIARPFWVNCLSEDSPKFVILMGGVASGKTTIRKEKFSKNFVNFDFGEIEFAVKSAIGPNNPELERFVILTCALILRISLSSKRNIVIEIIGDDKDVIDPILGQMKKNGYAVSIEFVTCDPEEAYRRHIVAVENGKDYLSAYFTQQDTLFFFYQYFGLGKMPIKSGA
jgi:hypothetical protein